MSVVLPSKAAAIRCIIEALHEASVPTCSQGGMAALNAPQQGGAIAPAYQVVTQCTEDRF